jgi:hypothetical protein
MRKIIISTTTAVTLFSSAAFTQQPSQGTASIPDFSGIWAHLSAQSGFEPLPSGPRPATGLLRRDTNPILKPEAAQVVKKYGEIEISGLAHPTPSNHCWPSG